MSRNLLFALAALALPALSQTTTPSVPSGLMVGEKLSAESGSRPNLRAPQSGELEVLMRLTDPPLAAVAGGKRTGWRMTPAQQQAYVQQLQQKQDAAAAQATARGARVLGRLSKATNGVLLSVNRAQIDALRSLPGVASVKEVIHYKKAVESVRELIGATALATTGVTGAGVRIAVIDSGIDYTHRNLGGPGTVAAYQAALANPASRDGLFPTAKVFEGFDFVGPVWPNGARSEDPDPLDVQGHGTHVADIAAGKSTDGTHKGVAPDARLLAVKVCSDVSTSCNGVAILKGIDYAADPDGNNDLSDAVDVMSLSLGLDFGVREEDTTEALRMLARAGVVVVASAGNGGNIPYILGSPSSGPTIISVAQTTMPTEVSVGLRIDAPPAIAGMYRNTATLDWAPVGSGVTNGSVAFVGRGCTTDTYLTNPAGKVALIDRGACDISEKIDRAAKAGAVAVLIGLVAAGDAVSFSKGAGDTFVPSLVITKSVSDAIKAQLNSGAAVLVTFGPATAESFGGNMISSSSRGPSFSYNGIKPDLGAPGGSISAQVGTGTGETPFGGTSGAAPVASGAAALVLQTCPICTPTEVKARLMNTASTAVFTNNATNPGVLAPISRIGAGEVRVANAASVMTSAWDGGDPEAVSLSIGSYRVEATRTYQKKVVVRNYLNQQRTYSITPSFRYADDATSGAVAITGPSSISVPANGTGTFVISFTVNPASLPNWNTNAGSLGGEGSRLEGLEFDGYVEIKDAVDTVRLPWHVLPHKAGRVTPSTTSLALNGNPGSLTLTHTGGPASVGFDVFSLTGTSSSYGLTAPRGSNLHLVDLKEVGARLVGIGNGQFGLQFAISTWGERSSPAAPAIFEVHIDADANGIPESVLYNLDLGLATSGVFNGQNVVWIQRYNASGAPVGAAEAFFFSDVDFGSSTIVLTAPMAVLNLTPGAKFRYSVYAADYYLGGLYTDAIENMIYTPAAPRFAAGPPSGTIAPGGSVSLSVLPVPNGGIASPSQKGLLILYRNAPSGMETSAITVTP